MTRPLEVYGVTTYLTGVNGQVRAVVAATSWTAAARAMGCTVHHLSTYGGITANEAEVECAMSEPGTVYYQLLSSRYSDEYARLETNR